MLEPGREVWVTFTGDPKGPDSLAKGACSEAQDGVGVGGVQVQTRGWSETHGLYTLGHKHRQSHTPQLCHRLQEDNCLHPISHFNTSSP